MVVRAGAGEEGISRGNGSEEGMEFLWEEIKVS